MPRWTIVLFSGLLLALGCPEPDDGGDDDGEDMTPLATAYGLDLQDVNGDGTLDIVRTLQAEVYDVFTSQAHTVIEVWTRD